MDKNKKIIFLHIPKTAGQSVHKFLLDSFPDGLVCPARVNEQLIGLSRKELNKYQIFSGHLDWSTLDCIDGEVFTFTVLRDPMERMLSFYFYLRKSAKLLNVHELNQPHRTGLRYALNATAFEYFVDPQSPIRSFIDSHYDNFYTYFFAGRRYDARPKLLGQIGDGLTFSSMDEVSRLAQQNMTDLGGIYTLDNWMNRLHSDLEKFIGAQINTTTHSYKLNEGDHTSADERKKELTLSDQGNLVIDRLNKFSEFDNKLWNGGRPQR